MVFHDQLDAFVHLLSKVPFDSVWELFQDLLGVTKVKFVVAVVLKVVGNLLHHIIR